MSALIRTAGASVLAAITPSVAATSPAVAAPSTGAATGRHVSLEAGTVTMVYAVGNPRTHSMNVILHKPALSSNGAVSPARIDTGSAGLAADLQVRPFSGRHSLRRR